MYGEHCTLAVRLVTEHIERFSFGVGTGVGTFHFSKQKEVHMSWGEGAQGVNF